MSTEQMASARARIDEYYAAWNRGDVEAIVATFARGGSYGDPLTAGEIQGDDLREHVESVLDVVGGLRVTVLRAVSDDDAATVVWSLEGTWDGRLGGFDAPATRVQLEGTDVFEF